MTILETIPIFEQPGIYNNLLLTSCIVMCICFILALFLFLHDFETCASIFLIGSALGVIIFIISIILTITEPKVDTGRVKYIIRLDDSYSINEFYDKYKVLEHTKYTNVYTVEEIND